jgi:copper homeostasis protein
MTIEICANSLTSALNAQLGGAHRIELCSELSLGGITPSAAIIQLVRERLDIPAFVLIRPRGGDFCYSNDEIAVMERDIEFCKQVGCDGVVIGVLKSNGTIDIDKMKRLIEAARPMQITFHRAFDVCQHPFKALENIKNLGIERILTSGQNNLAADGMQLLKQLVHDASGKVSIMAGSGVNAQNALAFQEIGIQELHFSAKTLVDSRMTFIHPNVQLETTPYLNWLSSVERIRKMIDVF